MVLLVQQANLRMVVPQLNLWHNLGTRGPVDSACTSGRCQAAAAPRILSKRICNAPRGQRRAGRQPTPTAQLGSSRGRDSLSFIGSSTLALSYQQEQAEVKPDSARARVTVTYEDTSEDTYIPAPSGGSKTLKINVDLILVGVQSLFI